MFIFLWHPGQAMEITFHGDKVKVTEGWMKWGRICAYQRKEGVCLPFLFWWALTEPDGKVNVCKLPDGKSDTKIFWRQALTTLATLLLEVNRSFSWILLHLFYLYLVSLKWCLYLLAKVQFCSYRNISLMFSQPCSSQYSLNRHETWAVVINECVTSDYWTVLITREHQPSLEIKIKVKIMKMTGHKWILVFHESSSVFNVIWDESLWRVKAISSLFPLSVQFSVLTTPQGSFACLFQRLRLGSKKKEATHNLDWDRSKWGTHGSLHTHTTVFQF